MTSPADDTLILTVNNRLAREQLRNQESQLSHNAKVWHTPNVLAWSTWLNTCYETLVDLGQIEAVLLTSFQERLIWESIIRRHSDDVALLRPDKAAQSVQEAYQRSCAWQLDESDIALEGTEESRFFLRWKKAFETHCTQHHLLSASQLTAAIILGIDNGFIPVPKTLQLIGFEQFSPEQAQLIASIKQRGCQLVTSSAERLTLASAERASFHNEQDEILAACSWAKRTLAAEPNAQVAIVSPVLQNHKHALQRQLSRLLTPRDYLNTNNNNPAFNISLGEPLSDHPIIDHALKALHWLLAKPMPLEDVSILLRSPFIGGHSDEWDARAQLDKACRSQQFITMSTAFLATQAQETCPTLNAILNELSTLAAEHTDRASPADWASVFRDALNLIGWPGDRSINSVEYQTTERFKTLLSEYAGLQRVQKSLTLPQAHQLLTQLAQSITFQAKTAPQSIHVLGVLEAAGLRFDAIWFLGVDDQHWPASPNPNPWLPKRLQRDHDMPNASHERELKYARSLLNQLRGHAKHVIASYTEFRDDAEQRPSPLITDWPEWQHQISDTDPIEDAAITETTQPLAALEAVLPVNEFRGGSGLVSAQAQCPFKAFARYRLNAESLDDLAPYPDAMLTGNIMHSALEQLFKQIDSSQKLKSLTPDELSRIIDGAVETALQQHAKKRLDIFTPSFQSLESQRLKRILHEWLSLEASRPSEWEIASLEHPSQVTLGELTLKIKLDRVDKFADGTHAVIDYKTGRTHHINEWTEDRPSECQIPLYAMATQNPSAGAIAQVHAKESQFIGLADNGQRLTGAKAIADNKHFDTWNELLAHWQTTLNDLATELTSGRIDVEPKKYACDYCELDSLCRISQAQLTEEIDDADS